MVSLIGEFIAANLAYSDSCDEVWSAMLSSLINFLFKKAFKIISLLIVDSPSYILCSFIYASFAVWKSCIVQDEL